MLSVQTIISIGCQQNGHRWTMSSPPQFMLGEHSVYCYCDCGEKSWVLLPKTKFDQLYDKTTEHVLTDEDFNIGRV